MNEVIFTKGNVKYFTCGKSPNLPKTGDLLLFRCNSWISLGIRIGTRGSWSHVGIAVWVQYLGETEIIEKTKFGKTITTIIEPDLERQLYVLESDNTELFDILSETKKRGLRIAKLSNYAENCSSIGYRSIIRPEFEKIFLENFVNYALVNNHKWYEHISSLLVAHRDNYTEIPDNRIYCTELCGEFYWTLGIFPRKYQKFLAPGNFEKNENIYRNFGELKILQSNSLIWTDEVLIVLILIFIILIIIDNYIDISLKDFGAIFK